MSMMRLGRHHVAMTVYLGLTLVLARAISSAQEPASPAEALPEPTPVSSALPIKTCPGPSALNPTVSQISAGISVPAAQPRVCDRPLPINLPTALRLSGGRPIVIAAATANLQAAAAELERAHVAWLPSLHAGAGYYRHDGAVQGASGTLYDNRKDQFLAGGGVTMDIAATDAIFAPLAARQIVRAREIDIQAARNDALLSTAEAYFNVQRARGAMAGAEDIVAKAHELAGKVQGLGLEAAVPTDVNRTRALLAQFDQAVESAQEEWRTASADLTMTLRLDPSAIVVPLEPPEIKVTLISAAEAVDTLIPIGLTNRPELASQQSLVQAALTRIRQERMRPLIPSLVLQGGPGSVAPGNDLMGGIFASTINGSTNPTLPRNDVSLGLYWNLENLGFGNRALVHARRAEQQQMLVQLFRIQDQVAAEIVRAHAQLQSADARVGLAVTGLREAQTAYAGSMEGLGKVVKLGDTKVVVQHALDTITSLQSLARAYVDYFASIGDYNTAQFRLYRALGYPAEMVACGGMPGALVPVDTSRPVPMAPVCAPDGCR
jgi:outer membrane protein TolC